MVQAGAETLYLLMPDAGRSATAMQARAEFPLYKNPHARFGHGGFSQYRRQDQPPATPAEFREQPFSAANKTTRIFAPTVRSLTF
jgi:hypothetical protein